MTAPYSLYTVYSRYNARRYTQSLLFRELSFYFYLKSRSEILILERDTEKGCRRGITKQVCAPRETPFSPEISHINPGSIGLTRQQALNTLIRQTLWLYEFFHDDSETK